MKASSKVSNDDNLINLASKDNEHDSLWIRKTHAHKLKQKVQLQEYADLFITNQYKKLRHALSLKFFLDCEILIVRIVVLRFSSRINYLLRLVYLRNSVYQ